MNAKKESLTAPLNRHVPDIVPSDKKQPALILIDDRHPQSPNLVQMLKNNVLAVGIGHNSTILGEV